MSAGRGHRTAAVALSTRPVVSVVITAVEDEQPGPALSSALAQRGVDLDVVVVTVRGAAAHIAPDDPRVRVLAVAAGTSTVAARNSGLALVRGEAVMVLPSSHVLTEGALERAAAVLEAHPWVGAVHGGAEVSEEAGRAVPSRVDWTLWSGSDWIERTSRHGADPLVDHAALVRRSVADELGGYAPDLPRTADLDYGLRLAAISGIARVNGVAQTACRPAPSGDPLTELRERHDTIEQFFTGFGHDSSGRTAHGGDRRERAARALAHEAMGWALLHRASADPGERADGARFASVAAECWPSVVDSREWRRFVRRGEREQTPSRRALELGADRVRAALPWRRADS
ncbi:Glycosyltransferase like family 2 [Rathayibacter oskolensis]|uniref:Glycosyltransferase like family 2 n=1 Tax=Rathayibacter oskolensis TaxID=1891671 RepID=A0A1X7NNJ2_9MICO|nr:glycosyltransferase [Rathayibacter oskolensis]SMH39617.1 Glycosyltransferase like family 2 [Rathayibacter oskolensis]